MCLSTRWQNLVDELRNDANRAAAIVGSETERGRITSNLAAFEHLLVPQSEVEMTERRALASKYRKSWSATATKVRSDQTILRGKMPQSA